MPVGVCRVNIILFENRSLKGKRRIIKSIKDKVRNNFNVSIAEVDCLDKLQKSIIEIAFVSNDRKFINEVLAKVINFIDKLYIVNILDFTIIIY